MFPWTEQIATKDMTIMKPCSAWQDWVKAVAGGLLFISPWISGDTYDGSTRWNFWIFGALILAAALWVCSTPKRSGHLAMRLFGFGCSYHPYCPSGDYSSWNAVVTGALPSSSRLASGPGGRAARQKVSA